MAQYKVKPGDNLSSIAKQYGTTASAIYTENKSKIGPDANRIYSGTTISIPGGGSTSSSRNKPNQASKGSLGAKGRTGSKPAPSPKSAGALKKPVRASVTRAAGPLKKSQTKSAAAARTGTRSVGGTNKKR